MGSLFKNAPLLSLPFLSPSSTPPAWVSLDYASPLDRDKSPYSVKEPWFSDGLVAITLIIMWKFGEGECSWRGAFRSKMASIQSIKGFPSIPCHSNSHFPTSAFHSSKLSLCYKPLCTVCIWCPLPWQRNCSSTACRTDVLLSKAAVTCLSSSSPAIMLLSGKSNWSQAAFPPPFAAMGLLPRQPGVSKDKSLRSMGLHME